MDKNKSAQKGRKAKRKLALSHSRPHSSNQGPRYEGIPNADGVVHEKSSPHDCSRAQDTGALTGRVSARWDGEVPPLTGSKLSYVTAGVNSPQGAGLEPPSQSLRVHSGLGSKPFSSMVAMLQRIGLDISGSQMEVILLSPSPQEAVGKSGDNSGCHKWGREDALPDIHCAERRLDAPYSPTHRTGPVTGSSSPGVNTAKTEKPASA